MGKKLTLIDKIIIIILPIGFILLVNYMTNKSDNERMSNTIKYEDSLNMQLKSFSVDRGCYYFNEKYIALPKEEYCTNELKNEKLLKDPSYRGISDDFYDKKVIWVCKKKNSDTVFFKLKEYSYVVIIM